jgi:hypothetical protein
MNRSVQFNTKLIPRLIAYVVLTLSVSAPIFGQQDIRPVLDSVKGFIHFQNETRVIYKNGAPGSTIQSIYEPAFFPFFNAAKSSTGKLVVTILMFDPSYEAAAIQAANAADVHTVALLPITGAVFSLGPKDPSEGPYTSVAAKSIAANNSDSFDISFDVPAKTMQEVADLADNSSVRVSYGILSQEVISAQCSISIQVTNSAIFSNNIHGPVTNASNSSTGSFSVSVTRNQFADAVSRGFITLNQACQTGPGSTPQQSAVASKDAVNLLPVLINQLSIQQKPIADALNELANFSFNGQDASTTITSYLNTVSQTIHNSSSDHVRVNGSVEASVLGIFGGKASVDVDKQHVEDSLNQQDLKFQFNGTQIIPASLNVITVRSGNASNVATLTAEQTAVTGQKSVAKTFVVPIQTSPSATTFSPTPVGAVIPFFLTPQEVARLAPSWLPANGTKVTDPLSPLNGRTLPNLVDRFVSGASPTLDVTSAANQTSVVGGTTSLDSTQAKIIGETKTEAFTSALQPFRNTPPLNTTIGDTTVDERVTNHTHKLDGTFKLQTELPLPPFSKLVYMVRVR